jgi:dsDNA-specific endonuclease/ATPase MutS2
VGRRIDVKPDDVTPPFDELGSAPLPTTGARLLSAVFSQRYERGSTIVTSRRRTQLERL